MKYPRLILAANHVDDMVRAASSSGGAFYALASFVLRQNGVVAGAAYHGTRVRHILVTELDELWHLQKSKYAPSSLAKIKKELPSLAGYEHVLFSGTPCQVKGLKRYLENSSDTSLRKLKDRIVWIEVACHGVPTLRSYREYIKSNGIVEIDFRCKRNGWRNSEIAMTLADGSRIYEKPSENIFYQDFLSGRNLRPACLNCQSKYFSSGADITLADFWGVEAFAKNMDDGKGTSLVLVHTSKGECIWNHVSKSFETQRIPLIQAIKWNHCIVRPLISEPTLIEKVDEWKNSFISRLYSLYRTLK